jgi:hypothetical protein
METATVSGRVTDQQGRFVEGAEVVITNVDTNVSSRQATSNDGLFVLSGLKPGRYRITVTKGGFRAINLTDVVLNVQDSISQNFKLQVGSVSESITVVADTVNMNTTDASVSTVVDRNFAENLPMNGRSFQTLIQLTPGVVLVPPSGFDGGQFSVNGQRAASNYWMVDGVSANVGVGDANENVGEGVSGALPTFSAQGGTNSLVSVDALQEFRIQTSTYAPEFGRTPGGQISIVTRSGTNQFHGTAFDYLRNDVFDANDWFADFTRQTKPEERQNDFGGTFSGPILRDRTFFFFSYEGLRLRLPRVALNVVPDVAARQAAITATQPILNAYPLPNGSDLGNGLAQFNASFSNASTLNATSLRIDHRVNDKLTLFGRYNNSPSELLSRQGTLSILQDSDIRIQTGTVGATWSLSAAITNDLRFNYSRSASSFSTNLDNFGGAVPLTASALSFPSPFTLRNAGLLIRIFSGLSLTDGQQGRFLQQQYNLVDTLSAQRGSHGLKFGVDYRRLNPTHYAQQYRQVLFFTNIASVETGQLFLGAVLSARDATLRLQNLGAFAQDNWRISSRLTLTYGLRWDLDFAPSSDPAFPAVTNFNVRNLSTLGLAPPGTPPYTTTYGNVAPRIGGAYQLSQRQGWETVFRGGFGVFYDLATTQTGNLLSSSRYPFGGFKQFFGGSYPFSSSQLAPPPISPASLSSSGVEFLSPDLRLPYTLQWNAAVEQTLGLQQTMSASYIGSVGRRLLQTADVFSPNPTFGEIIFVTNAPTSDYHALQLQFQRRLSHGLQALASYGWSHSIDSASAGSLAGSNDANTFVPGINPQANRGPSDFDIRNAFSAAVTYDIPALKTNGFAKVLLGGWSVQNVVQARSAQPVNVFDPSFRSSNAFNADLAIRPDVMPGQPLYLYGSQCLHAPPAGFGAPCPGGKGFNPSAFLSPPIDANGNATRQGNLGRNALRGFGAAQWDLAVHREFPIRESLRLQFRAEIFNILNHPNFGPPVSDLSSGAQFGQSIQMLGQSLSGGYAGAGGFNPLYQIGGPRSIQLALKLQF